MPFERPFSVKPKVFLSRLTQSIKLFIGLSVVISLGLKHDLSILRHVNFLAAEHGRAIVGRTGPSHSSSRSTASIIFNVCFAGKPVFRCDCGNPTQSFHISTLKKAGNCLSLCQYFKTVYNSLPETSSVDIPIVFSLSSRGAICFLFIYKAAYLTNDARIVSILS